MKQKLIMKGLPFLIGLLLAPLPCLMAQTSLSSSPQDLGEYPKTDNGLRRLIGDLLNAARSGDSARVGGFAQALLMPEDGSWLQKTFGASLGTEIASSYQASRESLKKDFERSILEIAGQNLPEIEIRRFTKTCDERVSTGSQLSVLLAREEKEPLYEVRILDDRKKQGRSLWFFAWADGRFRYLGLVKLPNLEAARDPAIPLSEVPQAVQRSRLISQVRPRYPQAAKDARLQGTVRLAALIGFDGAIRFVRLAEGHCVLAEAAIDAVRHWRYTPVLVDGRPVEVHTTIDVVFSLSN